MRLDWFPMNLPVTMKFGLPPGMKSPGKMTGNGAKVVDWHKFYPLSCLHKWMNKLMPLSCVVGSC